MAAQSPGFHLPPPVAGAITGAIAGLGFSTSFGSGTTGSSAVQSGTDVVQTVNNAFNLQGWFLRIGEILVGLVLIGIGLNAMLKGKPLQVVTGTAGMVGKAVPK